MLIVQQEMMDTTMEKITSPAPLRELSSIWLKARPISTKISIRRMGRASVRISGFSVKSPRRGLPKRQIDPSDIKTIRSECNQILTEYSWKAIYASNDDEFRQLWQEMKDKLDGFGYQKVLEFDWKNFEDAKAAVQEVLNAG